MASAVSRLVTGLKYSSILAKTTVLKTWNKEASRHYLLDSLGSMPGVSAKAAQFLAMKMGVEPNRNPVRIEAMPISWVKAQIEAKSPALAAELIEISDQPMVASLGQVHEAKLRCGTSVAIKVQFPGLSEGFAEHLAILRGISKLGPPRKFQFEMDQIVDFFADSLAREIDYRLEAKQQEEARASLPPGCPIVIAKTYPEYSCSTILVQSYEASSPLHIVQKWWPDAARRQCSRALSEYFLWGLFQAHFLHTDPHPGNLGFRNASPDALHGRDFELVLYDFGSIMRVEPQHAATLWQMIGALQNNTDLVPFDYLVSLGFDAQKLLPTAARLPSLMQKLLEPFCVERAFDFRTWNLKDYFERVLAEERWWFRSAGPAWFLMFMRAAQGFIHSMGELKSPVPIKRIATELGIHLAPVDVPAVLSTLAPHQRANTHAMAQKLFVRVDDQHGEAVVSLELPSQAIDELEDLIPEDTLLKMREQKIDFEAIKAKAQKSGYTPQALFEARTDQRRYLVWLG